MYDTISLTRVSSFQLTTFYLWFVCVFGDFGEQKEWLRVTASLFQCVYVCLCEWPRLQIQFLLFCFNLPLTCFVPLLR